MKQEQGLSEVIGFLMIIALLGILFSMYLLYVVPLQGRDSEITHMAQVKEQFAEITMDINSLIVNEKIDYPLQRVISLGSGQGGSTGAFSIFPVQSLSGSSGTLTVDSTDPSPTLGNIYFCLNAIGTRPGNSPKGDFFNNSIIDSLDTDSKINIDPHHFFLNYYVKDPVNSSDVIYINANNINTTNWSVIARVIDRYDKNYVNITNYTNFPGELTITIKKGGNTTIDNLTVYEYVEKNKYYFINLYDWGYGLADVLGDTNNITYRVNDIAERGPFLIGQVMYPQKLIPTNYDNIPITTSSPLSMFSFQSDNKHWVNQEYQYQWGASFVKQSEGTALIMLPPVSIEMVSGVINIDLTDINVQPEKGLPKLMSISGTQNNPVIISLTNISEQIDGYELLNGVPNAKYLIITVTASNFDKTEKKKWEDIFLRIVENAKKSYDKYSDRKITPTNITSTSELEFRNQPSVNLIIADSPGVNLPNIVGANTELENVITTLNAIPENNLKVSYKKANITFSLFNLEH